MKSLMTYLGLIILLPACTTSQTSQTLASNDKEIQIEEEEISQPQAPDTKKKVTIHHDGISVIDVMDFAFELYEDSEIAEEKMKVHNEKLKENLPSGSRANNP